MIIIIIIKNIRGKQVAGPRSAIGRAIDPRRGGRITDIDELEAFGLHELDGDLVVLVLLVGDTRVLVPPLADGLAADDLEQVEESHAILQIGLEIIDVHTPVCGQNEIANGSN
jgi:hypothetical protein